MFDSKRTGDEDHPEPALKVSAYGEGGDWINWNPQNYEPKGGLR